MVCPDMFVGHGPVWSQATVIKALIYEQRPSLFLLFLLHIHLLLLLLPFLFLIVIDIIYFIVNINNIINKIINNVVIINILDLKARVHAMR